MVISAVKEKKREKKSLFSLFYLICDFSGECVFLLMHVPCGQARAETWSFWNPLCSPELWSVWKFRIVSASLTSTLIKSHKHSSWVTVKFPAPNVFRCSDLCGKSKYSNLLSQTFHHCLFPSALPGTVIFPAGSLPPLTVIAEPTYLLHQQLGTTFWIFLSILHTCAT